MVERPEGGGQVSDIFVVERDILINGVDVVGELWN